MAALSVEEAEKELEDYVSQFVERLSNHHVLPPSSSATPGQDAGTLGMQKALEAELLVAQGRHQESLVLFVQAMEALREARSKSPLVWESALCSIGSQWASTSDHVGDLLQAEEAFREVLGVQPNHCICMGDYAVFLHRRKRDFDQAQHYYSTSLSLYPQQSSIHLKYAGFLRHVRRDLQGAEKHYRLAIETNPSNADALGSYASFLHGVSGNIDAAEKLYERAVLLDDLHANNLCNFGLFLSEERGDFAKAEAHYARALVHSPKHANTLYNYAVMLDTHCKRKEEAEVLYRRSLEVEPRHAFALYNLAVLLEEKTTTQELEAEKIAKESNGGAGAAVSGPEAERLTKEKMARRREVAHFYKRAVEASPRDATTAADYGRYLLTRLDDFETAESVLCAALQIDADNLVAMYHLAYLTHKHKANLPAAEALFKHLLIKSPRHTAATQQLARVYVDKFKKDKEEMDLDDALVMYEKAIALLREPTPAILEYLKVVTTLANNTQKLRGIAYIDVCLKNNTLSREADIKQLVRQMGKVIDNTAPPP